MRDTCAYCVQWRCARCKSHDWPDCCDKAQHVGGEPYWPDGSVALITRTTPCARCKKVMDEYFAEQRRNPEC